jgi:hypothetical protein
VVKSIQNRRARVAAVIGASAISVGVFVGGLGAPVQAADKPLELSVVAVPTRTQVDPLIAHGWQANATYNVPTNTVSLQYGFNCPSAFPVAWSGAFAFNSTGQSSEVYLTFNGPRIDIPSYNNWAWHFYWPGGSPAGTSLLFSVSCQKNE